jgi:hypothetical protein
VFSCVHGLGGRGFGGRRGSGVFPFEVTRICGIDLRGLPDGEVLSLFKGDFGFGEGCLGCVDAPSSLRSVLLFSGLSCPPVSCPGYLIRDL